MLSTPDAVQTVYHSPNGVISGITDNKTIIDCATLEPQHMIDLSTQITRQGGLFLEAPVSGSKGPAEQGQLIFLCGGDRKVFDAVQEHLQIMGKVSHFLGNVGEGTKMKLIVNGLMANLLGCLAESIAIANKCNVPTDKLLEVINQGAMANPLFSMKGPGMISDRGVYTTAFPLKHALKDLKFSISLGQKNGVEPHIANIVQKYYEQAQTIHNHGESDFSAIQEVFNTAAKQN
jgi:3-hydroxyisobutyrate dehydrogenase-like beta-hydroxyacid dehydrogenase